MTKHTTTQPDCTNPGAKTLDNCCEVLEVFCGAVTAVPVMVTLIGCGFCSMIAECFSYIGCGD